MSKKSATILIISLLIIIGLLFGAYFFLQSQTGKKFAEDSGLNDFLPFGPQTTPPTTTPPTDTGSGNGDSDLNDLNGDASLAKLRQIWPSPVAGAVAFDSNKELRIRFVERGTGHVFELKDGQNPERISNTTVPKIYEAIWSPDGKKVYLRYLKDGTESIETFEARFDQATSSSSFANEKLTGSFLPKDLAGVVVNPNGDKVFFLTTQQNGTAGVVGQKNNTVKTEIFNSLLSEWLVSWPNENIVALTTKPSSSANGSLYYLNPKTGALTRILDTLPGLLTTPSADGNFILASGSTRSSLSLYNRKTSESDTLAIATLADKCVWSGSETAYCAVPNSMPSASYPDAWYQGKVQFSDSIWRIETTGGSAELIASLSDLASQDIDAFNLSVDPEGQALIFNNKQDLSLWMLRLK